MTEKELIVGCIKEDAVCQKEVFRRFAGKMLSVCRRYARSTQDAEDILQDGFVKVFDKLSSFKDKGSFEGWIRKIMVNTALNHYRKKSWSYESSNTFEILQPSYNSNIVESMSADEIHLLINALPEGYKVVFNMYIIEGYSHREISEALGINESTSRSQLVKARRYLQESIEKSRKTAI